MNLQADIAKALQLTVTLSEHLAADDWEPVSALVAERAVAMAAWEAAHRVASAEELAVCAGQLAALSHADQALRQTACAARNQAAGDWQRSLGQAPAPRHDYDRSPDLACLDRRA